MSLFTSTGCCCEGDPCVIIPLCGLNWNVISGSWSFSNCTAINDGLPGTILYNVAALADGQKIGVKYNIYTGTVRLIIDAADENNYLAGEISSSGAVVTFRIIRRTGGVDAVLISRSVTLTGILITSPYNRFTFCFNPVTGWAVLDAYHPASTLANRTQVQTTVSGNDFVGFFADESGVPNIVLSEYFALNVYGTTQCEPCINSPPPQCSNCPSGVRPQTMFVTFNNVKNLILNPTRCGGNCGQFNTTFALPVVVGNPCAFRLAFDPDICAGDSSFGGDPNKGYTSLQASIGPPTQPYSVNVMGAVPANNNETVKVTFGFNTFAGKPAPAGHPTCQPPGLNLFFLTQAAGSPCEWAQATCLVSF